MVAEATFWVEAVVMVAIPGPRPCLEARPRTWYRYHHHRFYPESRFSYHELSIEKLDAAFARNFNAKATGLSGAPLVRPIVASTSFSPHSLWSRWLASKWRLSPQIGRGDAPN